MPRSSLPTFSIGCCAPLLAAARGSACGRRGSRRSTPRRTRPSWISSRMRRISALVVVVDDARPAGDVAVLGGVGDRVAHAGDALLVHEVDDQLHLVEALEVRRSRAGSRPSTSVSKPACTSDVRPPHSTTCSPNRSVSVSSSNVVSSTPARVPPMAFGVRRARAPWPCRVASWATAIEARHAAALGVGAAHEVAGALRRHHRDVDAFAAGLIWPKRMLKPWAKNDGVAAVEVRRDRLPRTRRFCSVSGSRIMMRSASAAAWSTDTTAQAGGLGLGLRRRAVAQADAHVDARVLQVEGVGVALRAVADDRHLAAGDERAVGVLLVVHVAPCSLPFPSRNPGDAGSGRALELRAARPGRCAAAPRCRTAAAAPRSRRPCRGAPSSDR